MMVLMADTEKSQDKLNNGCLQGSGKRLFLGCVTPRGESHNLEKSLLADLCTALVTYFDADTTQSPVNFQYIKTYMLRCYARSEVGSVSEGQVTRVTFFCCASRSSTSVSPAYTLTRAEVFI